MIRRFDNWNIGVIVWFIVLVHHNVVMSFMYPYTTFSPARRRFSTTLLHMRVGRGGVTLTEVQDRRLSSYRWRSGLVRKPKDWEVDSAMVPSPRHPPLKSLIRMYSTRNIVDNDKETSTGADRNKDKKNDDEIYQELQWLSQEIQRHDNLYYSLQQPELTDDEFDALVEREQSLAEAFPHLLQRWQDESGLGRQATRQGRVGGSMAGDVLTKNSFLVAPGVVQQLEPRLKRKHLAPMLSLDNVYNDDQLWAWLKRIPKVLDEDPNGVATTTKVTIYTEPKLDGVSLSLRYRRKPSSSPHANYELEWASTRGDGQQGQDVTFAVRAMDQTIPQQLISTVSSLPDTVEIRGEVVLPNSEFGKISELMPNVTFSNARNAASGILLRKETEEEVAQMEASQLRCKLRFYAYDMVVAVDESLDLDGDAVQKNLKQMGFSIPSPVTETVLHLTFNETMEDWSDDPIAPMLSLYQALKTHREGLDSQMNQKNSTQTYDWGDFEMDGCVHKISQSRLRQVLGRSMKSPKWAVAHKFPPKAVVTKLLGVTVQVGRTGALTPVALLDPVDVGGVTIQRATLHNFGHLQQILGGTTIAVGTSVLVRRAGEVIPQVVQRIGNFQVNNGDEMISLEAPKHCPACSSPVVLDEITSTGVGQVLRCGGPPLLCPPRAVTSLVHAFSRDGMDVSGLSESRIQQLMDVGLLRLPSDIYQLGDEGWAAVQELRGWGPKSCQNLRSAAERVSTTGVSLSRFIYSLGIRHLGKGSSEIVASCYVTKVAFLEALDKASEMTELLDEGDVDPADQPFSELQGQIGVGPVLIQSLVNFAKTRELLDAAKTLSKVVRVLDEEQLAAGSSRSDPLATTTEGRREARLPWKGLRVVFTGSIPGYSRSESQKLAKRLGAKATPESVSKSTDLVVFGEKGGKKLDQAYSLGVRTMTAADFVELVNGTLD